jgi:hypothetical protein
VGGAARSVMVGILMIHGDNPNRELNGGFENAAMQAIIR